MKADLHLHSTASDGKLSPRQLVRLAAAKGLEVMALTDHDTVLGVPEAQEEARGFPGLRFIPGVEVATDVPKGEVHILGYFIDHHHPHLLAMLERQRNARVVRAQKMLEKLRGMGMPLEWGRVQELAQGESLGRPHIAQAMMEKGYVPDLKEAFVLYIGRDRPAYVSRDKLTPEEAVRLVLIGRGLPVLAHPLNMGQPNMQEIIARLKREGLVGMEVYYNGYTEDQVRRLSYLARSLDLLTLGGSDYHGLEGGMDTAIGSLDLPRPAVEKLLALARPTPAKP